MNEQRGLPRQRPHHPDEWLLGEDGRLGDAAGIGLDEVVRALAAPGTPEELEDETRYLSLFEVGRLQTRLDAEMEAVAERKSLRTVVISGRVAAVVAASLVAGVGMAGAYTGTLPMGLQSSAHRHLGRQMPPGGTSSVSTSAGRRLAPVPSESRSRSLASATSIPHVPPSGAAIRPDKDGVEGRCTAWSKGGLATTSSAYRQLVIDAGGVEGIADYCSSALAKPPKATQTEKATHTKPDKPPMQQRKDAGAPTGSSTSHVKATSDPPGQLKK